MQVELAATTGATEHVLRNMFSVYFSELSEFDADLVLNRHGLPMWEPFGGEEPRTHEECVAYNWWIRDRCRLFLILADGRPAGFVIVNADPPSLPAGIDFDLLDFFVAHKYRRRGIGRRAAVAAFDLFRGRWEVAQLDENARALAFWHTVIREYTGGRYSVLDNGSRQRFRNDGG